ncbi:hypothetical protein SG34_021635 [Thalassomonas viridans]|uniref:Uncharacterized protein n=1 Tax=Thalassomonas viridans TaxID=137584 RepID=A0AAE9YZU2_9GAMM|nr:hypothetical protein [Thalassomonas viridans]WDE03948.1 hypothetical protein SG34_021635 [Thalassomonas viridans]
MQQVIKQYGLLLSVLVFLLLLKFIIVPVYEWQQQTQATNALLSHRLHKSTFALNNRTEIAVQVQEMQKQLSSAGNLFFDYKDENVFQLNQQQWLEQQFERHDISVSNIGWQTAVPLASLGLIQHEVLVSFKGNAFDIQRVQVFFESQGKWIEFVDFNYRFGKRRGDKLSDISGRMSLRLYMQVQK